MRLDGAKINKWKDLVGVFLKYYKFNLKITLNKTSLMVMEKRNQESVEAYAQRWRDKATNILPPLIKIEMMMLFVNSFKYSYYEHLIGSLT
jgi:hypothetical protein